MQSVFIAWNCYGINISGVGSVGGYSGLYLVSEAVMNETIEVIAVEEKPIDRTYNAKGQKRQTHLEVMGGGIAYAVRSGYIARVLEVIECKSET